MLGPLVNAAVIIGCSLLGMLLSGILGKNVPDRFRETVMKALGLAVIYIGISGALKSEHDLVLILSLVTGAVAGELMNIDRGMNWLGRWLERKTGFAEKDSGGDFARGFVSATIIFCTGSMAIVGAMQSGLMNDYDMLFAKSILDGTLCIVFACEMGIGVAFAAVPTFLYEGAIAFISMQAAGFVPDAMITEMGAAGSLVVAAIGFNFLGIKEIKVANMIPAVFMPCLIMGIQGLI